MKKILLLTIYCCIFSCLQAQELIVSKNSLGYVYADKNYDEEPENCKRSVYLKAHTNDSVYNKIKEDIRACLPPIVNDKIEQAIEKKVKVEKSEEFKESYEDFNFSLIIDKEGNATGVIIFLSEAMHKIFTEEMVKETYNCLMKVKIDMKEISLENANEFDHFTYHDSPVMEAKIKKLNMNRRGMKEGNMECK